MCRKKTTDEFVEDAINKHGNRYDYSQVHYNNSRTTVTIICPKHGEFAQLPTNHLRGAGCPKCGDLRSAGAKRISPDDFINLAKKTHGDKYDYSKSKYIESRIKIIIVCMKHGEFEQTPNNHLSGKGCSECCGTKKKTTENFIEQALEKHEKKYNYSKTNYSNNRTQVVIICPEHGEFKLIPSDHLQGRGCKKCNGRFVTSTSEFIERASIIHNNLYDYSKVEYQKTSLKVTIICEIHGEFNQRPNCHLSGRGCKTCHFSKGALAVSKYLGNQQISYETEKRFTDCKYKKTLPFDFYIPKINLLIEFDGEQHYEPVKFFGGEEAFEKQQIKDKIKDKYAKDNSYYLVRIRDINSIETALKPYVELCSIENPESYFVSDSQLFYDDLD